MNFLYQHVSINLQDLAESVWTGEAISARVDTNTVLPRPNAWTLDGAAIATLCEILENKKPVMVVELGSGLSTLIIGSFLKKNGGKLISIDHDHDFASATRSYVSQNNLGDIVEIRVAPVAPLDGVSGDLWYRQSEFNDIDSIDFLLVDGPPKPIDPVIRRHALPMLFEKLSKNADILLDDTNREGELRIYRRLVFCLSCLGS